MGLLDIFKKKKEIINEDVNENNIQEVNNYILTDVKKDLLHTNSKKMPIEEFRKYGNDALITGNVIKNIVNNKTKVKKKVETLYKVINIEKGDILNTTKAGNTYGILKNTNSKTTKFAKFKEVKSNVPSKPTKTLVIDPTTLMMAMALHEVEKGLNDILEVSKNIYRFLEYDKESEIEADLEILNNIIREYKYNYKDNKYLANNHKYVMDIKRTAKKNMNFYKKEIQDDILKNKIIVTDQTINSIQNELEKKFKYYRLSLYTYSYSSFLEILLLSNYQRDYLLSKKEELKIIDEDYTNNFELTHKFLQNTVNKSLESNLLKGIGTVGEKVGGLLDNIPAMKDNKVNEFLLKNGNDLKEKGNNKQIEYIEKFNNIKKSNTKSFINKIDDINIIYNNTKEIYFDNEYVYLDCLNNKE